MCSLIVLQGVDANYPLLIAANRDEQKSRLASPPGRFFGERRQILSPRDRVAGGTWIAVNDQGCFAGLTNVMGQPVVPGAPSRGHLPHLALDQDDLASGVDAVMKAVGDVEHSGFQLILSDGKQTYIVRNAMGEVRVAECSDPVICLTNEHAVGSWMPRNLSPAVAAEIGLRARLEALSRVLHDRGGDGVHAVCKHGDRYATVSSSLIAVPDAGVERLQWLYAPGPPDITDYRNYSNLAVRLGT
jgi:hypothetical protein